MPTNEDIIRAELSGVVLHRLRTLDPLGMEPGEEPLLDLLYSITRPPPPKTKRLSQRLAEMRKAEEAEKRQKPREAQEHVPPPKGMVNYRRERWGLEG